MRTDTPRLALVVWDEQQEIPECIALADIPAAIQCGALVLAREDEILSEPLPQPVLLSGPRRYLDTGDEE